MTGFIYDFLHIQNMVHLKNADSYKEKATPPADEAKYL
jgi:hypothetical protein